MLRSSDIIDEFGKLYDPVTCGWNAPPMLTGDIRFSPGIVEDWKKYFAGQPNYAPVELEIGRFYKAFVEMTQPRLILETGTHSGFSTLCLGAGLEALGRGTVYSLDPFNQNHIFDETTAAPFIRYLCAFSHSVPLEEFPMGPKTVFDLLVIDSDHTYPAITSEINRFVPMLRLGGHMLFHDTIYCDGLALAIRALMQSGTCEVITMETPRRHGRDSRSPGLTIARKIRPTYGKVIAADPDYKNIGANLPGRTEMDPSILD